YGKGFGMGCRSQSGGTVICLAHVCLERSGCMATGKGKWLNDQKGFGFILSEQGKDVFVHHTVIDGQGFKTLQENEVVEYDYEEGPKGIKATKVRRTATAPAMAT